MGESFDGSALLRRAVGDCPEVNLNLGPAQCVRCLLDTGAQVSTVTEAFYRKHLGSELMIDVSRILSISGAQGLTIPYCGYVELTVQVLGRSFHNMGFLVVRDPPEAIGERKRQVPGVIGSNVLRDIRNALIDELGEDYLREFKGKRDATWVSVLALYEEIFVDPTIKLGGLGRVAGIAPVLLQGRSLQTVQVSVRPARKGEIRTAIVQEIKGEHLQPGVKVISSLLHITDNGLINVPVMNLSSRDIYIQPRTPIGIVHDASEVDRQERPQPAWVEEHRQSSSPDVEQILQRMQLGDISLEQHRAMEELIGKYLDVFSKDEDDIGLCKDVDHRIYTTNDVPVKVPHRRIPPHHWQEVREYLKQYLDKGVIRESSSPYAAPVVLVRKKDGKLRLCVDYRALNSKTHKDAYPLPRIEEALEALRGARFFCSLDLAHGFHQIPVAEVDIQKTAFRVGTGGLYEFVRMPFGLCNAPATFMRLMDKGFGDQNFQTILTYLDDILVFGRDFDETLQRLEMVLGRLRKMNLKIKVEKCHLFKKKLKYLGHMVEEGGISPDPDKIRSIQEWKTPKTETELRSFLGLAGYYRRFVPRFATIATPLHALVGGAQQQKKSKGKKGKVPSARRVVDGLSVAEAWDESCDKAFQELKDQLTSAPLLVHPDFTKPLILETDASFHGLGAVLSQKQDGRLVVLGYASRGLRPHEKNMNNYSSMKLELLALYWAITEKFRDILLGAEFVVFTDNNPLSYLQTTAKMGATETRWQADLAQFNFEIKFRSGRLNANADALSRKMDHGVEQGRLEEVGASLQSHPSSLSTPVPSSLAVRVEEVLEITDTDTSKEGTASSTLPTLPREELAALQRNDPVIGKVLPYKEEDIAPTPKQMAKEGKPVRKLLRQCERLLLVDGILHRRVTLRGQPTNQLLVPGALKSSILHALHDEVGHQASEKTTRLAVQRFYWPGMEAEIRTHCKSCQRCVLSKAGRKYIHKWDH